ncbi:hypothetical protein [Streptomyces sp. BA2]|uniref:hypothetical protein n=1 Tax=Streptomyces sp. BA2 TaxID=436595 RepID=UPI0019221D1C|nr:hypothetical protein [Streptomyces sp. BA2]
MAIRIRTLLSDTSARIAARHLARTSFCDSCSQVCDAACRSTAHRRRTELSVTHFSPLR